MEPVLGGRDDLPRVQAPLRGVVAAMEPVLGGRDDSHSAAVINGSQAPQWSPSLADGTTASGRRPTPERRRAAMEPVLGGRDDRDDGVNEVGCIFRRNGARPWRTGRPPRLARLSRFASSRNGARPWRTGRPSVSPPAWDRRPAPQWSPSLADGTTKGLTDANQAIYWPQWSPSLADGTTRQSPCQ